MYTRGLKGVAFNIRRTKSFASTMDHLKTRLHTSIKIVAKKSLAVYLTESLLQNLQIKLGRFLMLVTKSYVALNNSCPYYNSHIHEQRVTGQDSQPHYDVTFLIFANLHCLYQNCLAY